MESSLADHSSRYAAQGQNAAPKQTAMQEHAAKLHDLATALAQCNDRLSSMSGRIFGPEPATAANEAKNPSPSGVLYVASFGAERIGLEIDRLRSAISKLEQVA